jgi:adenylate cyclase
MTDPTPQSFLIADLSGYSALTEREGDVVAAEVAIQFAAEASRLAQERGIEFVKRIGDGVILRGEDAGAVVQLGLSLQSEIAGKAGMPDVHAGVHTGCAVERGGEWWGATVNIAARVATAAEAGQLLITDATRRAACDLGEVRLRGLGPQIFKNISSPILVYAAGEPGSDSPAGTRDTTSRLRRRLGRLRLRRALPATG